MKKNLFLILAVISTLLSCKKSNDSYYLRCTINGTSRTFSVQPYAHKETDNGMTGYAIGGFETKYGSGNWFGFWFSNMPSNGSEEITAGTYSDSSPDFEILATYTEEGNADFESGTTIYHEGIMYSVPITNHFQLNITALDGSTVKGTFTGDFYEDGDVQAGEKIAITNGEFYLKLR